MKTDEKIVAQYAHNEESEEEDAGTEEVVASVSKKHAGDFAGFSF